MLRPSRLPPPRHDDPVGKWTVLEHEAELFRQNNGRWPRVWLDKVCIDQRNIQQSLRVLPVYLQSCKRTMVLCGDTYVREGGGAGPTAKGYLVSSK